MNSQDQLLVSALAVENLQAAPAPLLDWYDKNAREMPWRSDPTPYRVWISEIMLQQTRVEAVRDYYARFLDALPDVESLANAPEERLLKLWEGLGYYNRARNLQKAALVVMRQFEGKLPASYSALLSLPGIGEYTAGAIASIAFGIPVPAVDGNVLRVVSRILGSYADTSLPSVKQAHRSLLSGVIPQQRCGDFNQALMELGATVCLPNGMPLCLQCPMAALCEARRAGNQLELPIKAPKKARRLEARTIVLVTAGSRLLLFQRGKGLLGGMYELLNLEGHLSKEAVQAALAELGGEILSLTPQKPQKHIFTHVEWHMQGYWAKCTAFDAPCGAVWADSRELGERYAVPSAFRGFTKELPLLLDRTEQGSET